jgi:hypothetical protein
MFQTRVVEKIKTHILCSGTVLFFFIFIFIPENRAVMRKCGKYFRAGQATLWRMRIACWKPKATNTHTQFV